MVVIFLNVINKWSPTYECSQTSGSKDINAIFQFWSSKKKTHKVHMNNGPSEIFKKYGFGGIFLKNIIKIVIHMDLWKYGPILTIQKFKTMN